MAPGNWMKAVVVAVLAAGTAQAASTVTTLHGPQMTFDPNFFDGDISNSDLIQGLIATELPGDLGWHPVNPATANGSLDPSGLPAFTDGVSDVGSGLTGLLNDFPTLGTPAKLIQYDLAEASDIDAINIFSGKTDLPDGRVFISVVIRASTDNGANFSPVGGFVPSVGSNASGYYQSDPSGELNGPLFGLDTFTTFMSITDDGGGALATGVTNLQFDFYSVDNTGGQNRDPFDGVNPFTGVDDGLTAAFVSPLIWEIDVIGGPAAGSNADFDMDGDVDVADALAIQRDGTAQDLADWQNEFGLGSAPVVGAVPEPSTLGGAVVGLLAWFRPRRR